LNQNLLEMMEKATDQAGRTLAAMLDREIQILLLKVHESAEEGISHIFAESELVGSAVRLVFTGDLCGCAYLIFPEGHSRLLAEVMYAQMGPAYHEDVHSMESMLGEIGNVILNAVVGVLANQMGAHVKFSLPQVFEVRPDWAAQIPGEVEALLGEGKQEKHRQQSYVLTSQLIVQSIAVQIDVLVVLSR